MTADVQFRNRLELRGGGTGCSNRILGIIGRKGTGKSTLTAEVLQRHDREFIFDTAADHLWVPQIFTNLDEAYQFIVQHGAQAGSFVASYIPESEEEDELIKDFSEICSAVWEVGNLTLFVEEIPMLSQPQWVPPKFNRLVRLGRHRLINIGYTGQRASEIPRRLTGATDVFVFFHTSEPIDLEKIAERCGVETARLVAQLGEHEFLVFDVLTRSLVVVDEQWYDSVLRTDQQWTPAIGGVNGRPALWSLDDAE